MGKKKIVVDTNVIMSGFGWDGICKKALLKVITECEWIISREQILEIETVLTYSKLKNVPKSIIFFLEKHCTFVNISGLKTGDEMIIETALVGGAIILTGDKELLERDDSISVKEFLEK